MTSANLAALRRAALVVTPLALALVLPACDGDDGGMAPPVVVAPTPTPAPTPAPTPTPTPSPTSRNVTACLNQVIVPGTSITPTTLAVPDTLKLNFGLPNGYPNGRLLNDPVVDLSLAALLLDLTRHPVTILASLPLNPPNDNFNNLSVFPYLGPPNGTTTSAGTGTAFNFRTDPASSYVRVDRMGNPAIATALIGTSLKNAFNDANPADDLAGTFVGGSDGIVQQLTNLHNALADDLIGAGLTPCSTS